MAIHRKSQEETDEEDRRREERDGPPNPFSQIWSAIRSLEWEVWKRGERAITSRTQALEDSMDGVQKTVRRVERIEWGILLALIGVFLAQIFHH